MTKTCFEINRIIPFSNVDGPGNRFAIFLQECNFNCLYCHNPETINKCNSCGLCIPHCPVKALSLVNGKIIYNQSLCVNCDTCLNACNRNSSPKTFQKTVDELFKEIRERSSFIRGITFSGGECVIQHEQITRLFLKLKNELQKLTRLIDTNGYIDLQELTEFTNLTDAFILDIKAFDSKEHIRITGKTNIPVLKNLDYLLKKNKLHEVRTVICPNLFDTENTVANIAKLLSGTKVNYKLTKYRSHGVRKEFAGIQQPSDKLMNHLLSIAKKYHDKIIL